MRLKLHKKFFRNLNNWLFMNSNIQFRLDNAYTINHENIYNDHMCDIIIVILLDSLIPSLTVVSKTVVRVFCRTWQVFHCSWQAIYWIFKLINQKSLNKIWFYFYPWGGFTWIREQLKMYNSRKWIWWWLLHSIGFGNDNDDMRMIVTLLERWAFSSGTNLIKHRSQIRV